MDFSFFISLPLSLPLSKSLLCTFTFDIHREIISQCSGIHQQQIFTEPQWSITTGPGLGHSLKQERCSVLTTLIEGVREVRGGKFPLKRGRVGDGEREKQVQGSNSRKNAARWEKLRGTQESRSVDSRGGMVRDGVRGAWQRPGHGNLKTF